MKMNSNEERVANALESIAKNLDALMKASVIVNVEKVQDEHGLVRLKPSLVQKFSGRFLTKKQNDNSVKT